MQVKANVKQLRMSPRKVRLVVDVIRGMEVNKAMDQLRFINKLARVPVSKLLKSAVANAEHNFDLDKNNLFIKEIKVDEGKTLYRWMPKAHGRATKIRKRSCHIDLVLGELIESAPRKAKVQKLEAPVKLGHAPKTEKPAESIAKSLEKAKPTAEESSEKGKKIVDPRGEGHGKHTKIEGGSSRGFIGKVFRRKSG